MQLQHYKETEYELIPRATLVLIDFHAGQKPQTMDDESE